MKIHWGDFWSRQFLLQQAGVLTRLEEWSEELIDFLKNLSQYWCFARIVTVGGHFRILRKCRTSNIFVFCPFSREQIGTNSEKCIEYGK